MQEKYLRKRVEYDHA